MTMQWVLQPDKADRQALLERVREFVDTLPAEKPYRLEIAPLKKERTSKQNRALWGCAYKSICEGTTKDPEDVHRAMCQSFYGTAVLNVGGQIITRPLRTTTRNEKGERDVIEREQLAEFYTHVQAIFAVEGIDVPDPDPDWFK